MQRPSVDDLAHSFERYLRAATSRPGPSRPTSRRSVASPPTWRPPPPGEVQDASQVRIGAAPNVMAALGNLVIGVLSRARPVRSPPRCAATPATHAGPSPPSGSASMNPTSRQNDEPWAQTSSLAARHRATELLTHVLHESLTISPPPEEPVGIAST